MQPLSWPPTDASTCCCPYGHIKKVTAEKKGSGFNWKHGKRGKKRKEHGKRGKKRKGRVAY